MVIAIEKTSAFDRHGYDTTGKLTHHWIKRHAVGLHHLHHLIHVHITVVEATHII